jgi:hypothetical protein
VKFDTYPNSESGNDDNTILTNNMNWEVKNLKEYYKADIEFESDFLNHSQLRAISINCFLFSPKH